jgi:hypothetical protein
MVQAVAYDESTDLVALCKAYNGTSTDILLYNASTGALVKTVTVNDHIHTIDMRNGYLAMASYLDLTYYVYTLSDESIREIAFTPNYRHTYDRINQIFIDGNKVYTCNIEQHCNIECYDIATGASKNIQTLYEPLMTFYPDLHRIVALEKNCSPGTAYFIDSDQGRLLKSVWTTEGFGGSAKALETHVAANKGSLFDLNGNRINQAPTVASVTIPLPEQSVKLETVISSSDISVCICADKEEALSMLLRTSESTQTTVLDYYASGAIVTKSGDVLLFTEGGYGLILVKMN